MRTSDTSRRNPRSSLRHAWASDAAAPYLAIGAAFAWLSLGVAAQTPDRRLDDLLARVGERIEQYFARAQRILFGTDSTVYGGYRHHILKEQVDIIDRLELPPADRAAILGDNARRVLRPQ